MSVAPASENSFTVRPTHKQRRYIIPNYPFRKVAVVGEEIRVGPLATDAASEMKKFHMNLIAEILGDDVLDGDEDDVTTGWLLGEGPAVTLVFVPGSPAGHRTVATNVIRAWAKKENLTVSVPSATSK